MRSRVFVMMIIIWFFASPILGQSWQIHINGNETYHIGNKTLGYYPILWYSSDDDRGVLVGGFGLGLSYAKPLNEKIDVKYQFNVQRSRFYDSPIILRDYNGALIGGILGVNTNYNISGFVLPHIVVLNKVNLKVGLGLGFRYYLHSKSDFGKAFVNGGLTSLNINNNSRNPFLLTIPLEISNNIKRWIFAIRTEASVNSSSRLDFYKKEHSVMFFVEIGYKL